MPCASVKIVNVIVTWFMVKVADRFIRSSMSGGGAAAEVHPELQQGSISAAVHSNDDVQIEQPDQRLISEISETEFEQEIENYIQSDAWIPDIYVASSTPSASERISIEGMWDAVAAEVASSESKCDFDETLGVGFTSSTLAIKAANDYACTKLSWSQKPPQSKADLNVQGRINDESQKYQRLILTNRASARLSVLDEPRIINSSDCNSSMASRRFPHRATRAASLHSTQYVVRNIHSSSGIWRRCGRSCEGST